MGVCVNCFTIAKYLRISVKDTDLKTLDKAESDSIGNQRNLIDDFIRQMPEFVGANILEFCDDGWSGKNFARPAVQNMLEQVKHGKINCIIVKDLSRFGRDYLTVGNYISRVFPFLSVRFIAINDGLDSVHIMHIDSIETSFKTLLYDLYSRDLSYRVRSAKQFKAKQGDFLSPFAPYGYVKAENNRNQLVPDPEAAKVVHQIFKMTVDGIRPTQIAQTLNAQQVLTPMLYKRAAGCSRSEWPFVAKSNFWTDNTVIKILRDERYIGRTIYGKRIRDEVGRNHVIRVPRADWIIAENTHQGIVSKEEFELAQKQLQEYLEHNQTKSNRKTTMLYKKVCCGICGHVMKRVNAKQSYYICSTPRFTDAYSCMREHILECDLTKMVLTELHMQTLYAIDISHIWEEKQQNKKYDVNITIKMLRNLKESQAKLESFIQGFYEKFVFGELDKEGYVKAKRDAVRKRDAVSLQIEKLESKLQNLNENGTLENQFADCLKQRSEIEEITNKIVSEVLNRIIIYPNYKLHIIWNYQKDLRQLFLESKILDK